MTGIIGTEPVQLIVMALQTMPMPERDPKTGRYTAEYSKEEFADAIRTLGRDASTSAVADEVGCDYDAAYKKLTRMEDAGEATSRKIGNARLWEVTGDDTADADHDCAGEEGE